MKDMIVSWPKSRVVEFPCPLRLKALKPVHELCRYFNNDNEIPYDARELEDHLNRHPTLLFRFSRNKHNETVYEIMTSSMVLLCVPDRFKSDRLSIVGINDADHRSRRTFITESLTIYAAEGYVVEEKSANKSEQNSAEFQDFLNELKEKWGQMGHAVAPSRNLSPEFLSMLSLLESYTHLEYENENTRIASIGDVLYRKVESDSRMRQARRYYRFYVDCPQQFVLREMLEIKLTNHETILGDIVEIAADSLLLSFKDQFNFDLLPPIGTLRLRVNDIQFEVRKKTIEKLVANQAPGTYFEAILGQHRYLPLGSAEYAPSPDVRLNDSQLSAVRKGTRIQDMLLVLGPPGTGKTTVILEWVRWFTRQGQRVLISSKNNMAVDNVLERLSEEPRLEVVRVGHEDKVSGKMQRLLMDAKATDMQKKIIRSAIPYGNELDIYIRKLSSLLGVVQALLQIHKERELKMTELETAQLQAMQPYTDKLYAWHKEHELLTGQLTEMYKKMKQAASLYKWGLVWESRPAWLRWVGLLPKKWGKARYEKLHLESIPLKSRESETIHLYNENREKMELDLKAPKIMQLKSQLLQMERLAEQNIVEGRHILSEVKEKALRSLSIPDFDFNTEGCRFAHRAIAERLHQAQQVSNLSKEWRTTVKENKNRALYDIILQTVDVVGGTCIGINTDRYIADLDFDVTMIDEAGQIQAHDLIVPLSRSPKAIMVGDHLQLPPVAGEDMLEKCEELEIDSQLLVKSLFEYLYPLAPETSKQHLDTQYRMPKEIAAVISEHFYEGKYHSGPNKQHCPSVVSFFKKSFCIVDTSAESKRWEKKDGKSYINPYEAELIADLLHRLLQEGWKMEQIGVIVPYKKQAEYVIDRLKTSYALHGANDQLSDSIATVDSFQGQERKIIVFGFTRSNGQKRIGFLEELRRLNVSLTRPIEQLIIIGDLRMLENSVNDSFSHFIRKLSKAVHEQGDYVSVQELKRRWGAVVS